MHIIWRFFAACAILSLFVVPQGNCQEDEEAEQIRDYLEVQHALTLNFVTPHTDWAHPYAQGTTRVVYFVSWFQGSTDAREIVELMQRFDLDADAVYYLQGSRLVGDGRPDWYGGDPEAGTNRVLRLLEGAVDVLFFNQLQLESLPEVVRERIEQKIVEGTGVVLVGDKQEPGFPDATLLDTQPSTLPTGRYYTLGEGRIAILPNREKLEFRFGWETQFDYQMADQGRVLLWAAKREPTSSIAIVIPSAEINRSALGETRVRVDIQAVEVSGNARTVLRRWDGQVQELGSAPFPGTAEFPLPIVRAGEYHVNVFAETGNGIANWASAKLAVADDRRIVSVALDKNWAEVGESVQGHVVTSGELGALDSVVLRLVGNDNRVFTEEELPADAGFTLDIKPWMPMLMRVEAAIVEGDDEVASSYAYLNVTQRNRDQFNFIMWNLAGGDLAPYVAESLARNGVTAILHGGDPPLYMAQYGLAFVPYASSFRTSSHTTTAMLDPETGVLKSGCVHDEEAMWKQVNETAEHMQNARQLGVFAYSLGDENAVRASCLGPHCLAAYRKFLQDEYGAIDALNTEWGTSYASFDTIELLSEGELPAGDAPEWFKKYFADWDLLHRTDNEGAEGEALDRQVKFGAINDELRALQAGNFARWYDRQAFQNYSYVHWCKRFQEAFRKIDPEAWTGFEGTDSFTIRKLTTRSRQGGDLDAFVREMDYFGPYEGPANEVVRSIASPAYPKGNWIGYSPELDVLIDKYWSQIADQMNAVQWWRWDNLDGYNGYLTPSLDPFPAVKELLEDTAVVRKGLGTLLMNCEMHDDGIAMLYSLPSTYIAHFDGNDTYGLQKRDHGEWHRLLHGAGLQFRYVTDRMLRLGEFDESRYKVLILPLAFAMNSEEADVIRAFVQNGGTVIADLRPAVYDGHCKPLGQGLLDDVFGINRTGNREAEKVDRLRVQGEIDGHEVGMDWGNWHGKDIYPQMVVDPNVELTTGEQRGDAYHIHYWTGLQSPLCIVNEYGKGRAILLNFSVHNAPAEKFVGNLLAACGVTPVVSVTGPNGRPVRDVEVTRWANGDVELLALLGTHDGEVQVKLSGTHHVYDLKRKENVGAVETFTTDLRAHRASFFALSPNGWSDVKLSVPDAEMARGEEFELQILQPDAKYEDAVRLQIVRPDGQVADWSEKTLIVADGTISVPLSIAYNDPPGEWICRATSLLTGQVTEIIVTVR
jgi:hypothetical protein